MNLPIVPTRRTVRIGLVLLLVVAAFFAALPWLGCITSIRAGLVPNISPMLGFCTVGPVMPPQPQPGPPSLAIPGFTGPYWGNLALALVYLAAALYAAFTTRVR